MRWVGHVARTGAEKCIHFGRKPEGKKTLERPRYKWEENIRMVLREIGW
jgi:hypothetical protein